MLAVAPSNSRPAPSPLEKFLKEEWGNKAKFEANLRLARGLALFFGSIYVFRAYGEALFAA